MAPTLASLPIELIRAITSLLLLPDQAALCRTDKTFNLLLTPIVWNDIEMHHRGTHEGIDIETEISILEYNDPVEHMAEALADTPEYPYKKLVFESSSRKYAQVDFNPEEWGKYFQLREEQTPQPRSGRATDNCNRRNNQFGREETLVGVRKIVPKERWDYLSHCVRSLCMSIGLDDEVVEVIASFKNLRSLELVGLPLEKGHAAIAPKVELPNLQNLKLRGYLSAALVRNFCNNAGRIECLNLGLLATSTDDKAYSDTLLKDDNNWAVVTSEMAEYYQRNSAEAAALSSIPEDVESDINGPDIGENSGDSDEDEDIDEDERPFALHSPIWLSKSLTQRFTALTHLHLVKPYTGETSDFLAHDHFEQMPHRYEQVLCKEWVFLLDAVAGTLKELILEHRVPMEVGDTVGDGDPHPEHKGSNRSTRWSLSTPDLDRGDELFCRSVLRLLLEESSHFSGLKCLSFRGIQIKGVPTQRDNDVVPGKNGASDNDDLLRAAFPGCRIELFEQAYPIHVYAGYVYQSWPLERQEAMQDEGDGLLYDLSYFNNYKRRFGPQWRI